jgi:sec-independent protein translocase protein TatB
VLNFPGPEKILMLAIIALVVLGPSRLPQAARTAGKWIGELRKLTSRFQEELSGALAEPKDALTAAVGDLRNEVGGWRNEISGLTRSMTTAPTTDAANPAPAPEMASWTDGAGTNDGAYRTGMSPSAPLTGSVPSGWSGPGLPPLPPTPDDPSLN